MKKHSYAKFLIEQEIKNVKKDIRERHTHTPEGPLLAYSFSADLINLEETLKLLELLDKDEVKT